MAADRDQILATAMELAARDGWRGVSLGGIAAEAGVSLAELYGQFRSKRAILSAIAGKADAAMLGAAAAGYGDDEPVRDRLFDVLMARFDALQPYRDGLAAAARDTLSDPLALASAGMCHGPRLLRSMGWALEAAGVNPNGPKGMIRTRGLAAVYASVLPVWLRDESADLSATMAGLDKRLARAEKLAGLLRGNFRRAKSSEDGAPDAAPAAPKSATKKTAARKTAAKKAAPRKTAARKAGSKKKPAKKKSPKKR